MAYHIFESAGDVGIRLTAPSLDALFASAAQAFTASIVSATAVEPRRPEEVELAAPDLDLLLVDFLSELLYRFDTRAWLTREAEIVVREQDAGWVLEGTLHGEKIDPARHPMKIHIKAIASHELNFRRHDEIWAAEVVLHV